MRQAVAAGLGRADRCTDSRGPVGCDSRRRPLPADRATSGRQRITVGIPWPARDRKRGGVGVMSELTGKVAIVTGGASGIGAATVERFVAEGARVVIADVERERGEALAAACGADAVFRQTDVAAPDQVRALVSTTVETFGGLHVMFNNAGTSGTFHRRFFDDDLADFQRIMSVNVLGGMAGTKIKARHMA